MGLLQYDDGADYFQQTFFESRHNDLLEMWVDALVQGVERLSLTEMDMIRKEWRLSGCKQEWFYDGYCFELFWVMADERRPTIRYLRPTAQDFWMRVWG
jgi:hypothetical protein